jgi:hypothetical protein
MDLTSVTTLFPVLKNSMINRHTAIAHLSSVTFDLAGYCPANPSYLQIRARINHLINRYINVETLSDRLADLPMQFVLPQTRHWEPIDWQAINSSQILGVDPKLFALVLSGATEIEAPIREYSQESWQYLQALHPEMANFVGGARHDDGSIQTLGVWEKEERQHAPVFSKIYQRLTGEKLQPKPNSVADDQSTDHPREVISQHLISRISTEWGATAVYLWLMAHSTGALQQAIAQPLQDEINHLAKFWGFSRWAFGASYRQQLQGSTRNLVALAKHHQGERTHSDELLNSSRSVEELTNAIGLAFSLMRVMVRLRSWDQELSSSYLRHLFGAPLAKTF